MKSIGEKLAMYPEFGNISPQHYNESNLLKLAIEGAGDIQITNCEGFGRLESFGKLPLRLLFRWMFNKAFTDMMLFSFKQGQDDPMSSKSISIDSLVKYMQVYTESLKNDFFRLLNRVSMARQLLLIEEIIKLIAPKTSLLDLNSLSQISPKDIHLDEMKLNYRDLINVKYFIDYLENLSTTRIFGLSKPGDSSSIHDHKANTIPNGIEVLRFKVDTNSAMKFFQSGLIKGLVWLGSSTDYDVFLIVQKQIRRFSLFKCLFNRMRQNNGTRLLHDVRGC